MNNNITSILIIQLKISIKVLGVMTLLLGMFYPFFITGIAQALFFDKANGSLIFKEQKIVGSEFIGQNFSAAKYFHGRPSTTSSHPYNALSSGGSITYKNNNEWLQTLARRKNALHKEDLLNSKPLPLELITASASGLDPHISPASAYYQAMRIAKIRKLSIQEVQTFIAKHIEQRQLGFLGEPRVNILKLNLELDQLH